MSEVRGAAVDESVWAERPATTLVAGSNVVAGPGYSDPVKGGVSRQNRPGSVKVTVEEAAALQSFDTDLIWDATLPNGRRVSQGAKYQIVGNAVPVLLVERVLEALWAPAVDNVIPFPTRARVEAPESATHWDDRAAA